MDYTVKPLGKTCHATGADLLPGEVCHSILIDELGEKIRYDYSAEGWPGEPPDNFFACWKLIVPEAETDDRPKQMEPEQLFEFFEQILEDQNPAQEKIKYVIALLLMQKKRLKMDGTRHDGEISWLQLSGSQGEGPYEIRDQQLADDEIRQLQHDLNGAIFE